MMRSRRGQAAEVPPERVFGILWGQMYDQGWRVLAKPHWFARGDPRTWIYCAPEVLDAAGKLRSRGAGKLGESIFLDKNLVIINKFIGPISKNDYEYIKNIVRKK